MVSTWQCFLHKSITQEQFKKRPLHQHTHPLPHPHTPSQVVTQSRIGVELNRVFTDDYPEPVSLAEVSPDRRKGQQESRRDAFSRLVAKSDQQFAMSTTVCCVLRVLCVCRRVVECVPSRGLDRKWKTSWLLANISAWRRNGCVTWLRAALHATQSRQKQDGKKLMDRRFNGDGSRSHARNAVQTTCTQITCPSLTGETVHFRVESFSHAQVVEVR